MDLKNQLKLGLEKFDKCHVVCDVDCPLGQLYDFACAFQGFVLQKLNEASVSKTVNTEEIPED